MIVATAIADTEQTQAPAWGAVLSMALCVALLIASEFMPVSLLTPVAAATPVVQVGDASVVEGHAGTRAATFTASPIANDGKVFIASEDGQVFVLKAGPTYEVIAMNEMSTPILATPAISEGRLLLRTQDLIMAIGKK